MMNNDKMAIEINIIYLSIVFNIESSMLEYDCIISIFKNILDDDRRLDLDKKEYYLDQEAESIILNWKLEKI